MRLNKCIMHFQGRGKWGEERGLREVVRLRLGTWVTDRKLGFLKSRKSGTLLKKKIFEFESL